MDISQIKTLGDYLANFSSLREEPWTPIFHSPDRITGSANHLDHRDYTIDWNRMNEVRAYELAVCLLNPVGYDTSSITLRLDNRFNDPLVRAMPMAKDLCESLSNSAIEFERLSA